MNGQEGLLRPLISLDSMVRKELGRDHIELPRKKLTGDITLYVRADGSDTNDGRTNTSSGAFATIQRAVDVACWRYDTGSYVVTIQVQDATWDLTTRLILRRHPSSSAIILRGNTSTPANCVLQSDDSYVVHGLTEWSPWKMEGFTLQRKTGTTNNFGLVTERSNMVLASMSFGAHGTGAQVLISSSSYLSMESSTFSIVGAANSMLRSADHSIARIANAVFVFPGGGVAFPFATVAAQSHGSIYAGGNTFTNGALVTGPRYLSDMLAHIRTNGGGANYFPGNAAGTASNGGIYT